MYRVDWGNPKITIGEFHSYLETLLGVKFDGLVDSNGYMDIQLSEPLTPAEENSIQDYIYTLNNKAKEVSIAGPKDINGVPFSKTKPFADADGFRFRGMGISNVIPHGQTSFVDYTLTEERFLNGVELMLKDHAFDDSLKFQIVDKNYSYAGILYPPSYDPTGANIPWSMAQPNGVVLDEFGTDWNVCSDTQKQNPVILPYPARVFVNMTARIVYKSTGTSDVTVKANLFLHKKI